MPICMYLCKYVSIYIHNIYNNLRGNKNTAYVFITLGFMYLLYSEYRYYPFYFILIKDMFMILP